MGKMGQTAACFLGLEVLWDVLWLSSIHNRDMNHILPIEILSSIGTMREKLGVFLICWLMPILKFLEYVSQVGVATVRSL